MSTKNIEILIEIADKAYDEFVIKHSKARKHNLSINIPRNGLTTLTALIPFAEKNHFQVILFDKLLEILKELNKKSCVYKNDDILYKLFSKICFGLYRNNTYSSFFELHNVLFNYSRFDELKKQLLIFENVNSNKFKLSYEKVFKLIIFINYKNARFFAKKNILLDKIERDLLETELPGEYLLIEYYRDLFESITFPVLNRYKEISIYKYSISKDDYLFFESNFLNSLIYLISKIIKLHAHAIEYGSINNLAINKNVMFLEKAIAKFLKSYIDFKVTLLRGQANTLLTSKINLKLLDDIQIKCIGEKCISHYTSLDSLIKILGSKTLRYTKMDKLNDSDEGKVLSKHNWTKKQDAYSLSFTKKIDSLDLWSNYTNLEGVSVVFDKAILENITKFTETYICNKSSIQQRIFYAENFDVIYSYNEMSLILETTESIINSISSTLSNDGVNIAVFNKILNTIFDDVKSVISCFIKKPPFSYESEVRCLLFHDTVVSMLNSSSDNRKDDIEINEKSFSISRHNEDYRIFSNFDLKMIKGIYLSPPSNGKSESEKISDLIKFIKENNLNVDYENISYERLMFKLVKYICKINNLGSLPILWTDSKFIYLTKEDKK